MVRAGRERLLPILVVLFLAASASRADDDDMLPSFKSSNKRDSKEFVTKVGTTIIKAARSAPRKIELKDHSYASPKANRSELTLKMGYSGAVTKVKYNVDIVVTLDTSDKEKWEVLKIRYKDSNRSPIPHSEKRVQELIAKFNK